MMFNLMPKDKTFYDELERLAYLIVVAVGQLGSLLERWPQNDNTVASIETERHECHVLTRQTLRHLDEAFITPFDREDILQLANDLYGVVECVANVAERLQLYPMREIHPSLQGQCGLLTAIAKQVGIAVNCLRGGISLGKLRPDLDEIGRLEEQSRRERTHFLSELYQGAPDPLDVMKKKELHDLIVEAIRACDRVGRTIESVLLKNQ
jgi:uncharacterized protein Yka (UPF0111/DUF47 family)